jgi:hypothetical protein
MQKAGLKHVDMDTLKIKAIWKKSTLNKSRINRNTKIALVEY